MLVYLSNFCSGDKAAIMPSAGFDGKLASRSSRGVTAKDLPRPDPGIRTFSDNYCAISDEGLS